MEDYGTSLPSNKKKRNDSEDVFGGHNLWDDDQFSQSLPPTFASNLGYSGEWDLPKSNLTFSSEFGELKMSQELNMKVESLDDLPVQLHYDYADSDQSLNQTSQPMFFNQPTQPLQSTISQPVTNAQFQPPNPQQPQLFQQQQQQNQFQPQQPNPQQPQLFQQQQPMFQPQNTQSLPFNSPQFQSPQFNSQPLQFNSNQYTQPSPFQNNGIPFLDNKQPTIQIDYNSANSNVFLQNPQATQMRQTYMELVNNNPTTPHFNPSYMAHSPLTPVTPQSPMGSTVGFGNATTLSSFIMEVESKASHFRHVSDGIQAIMLQNQKIQQHKVCFSFSFLFYFFKGGNSRNQLTNFFVSFLINFCIGESESTSITTSASICLSKWR